MRFEWSSYDPTKPLVFLVGPPPFMGGTVNTPGVCWSTYLGGNGLDRIYASDTDDEGNYYAGGYTASTAEYFPIEQGVVYYEAVPMTAFVTKFGPENQVFWSTFYGGSDFPGTSDVQYVRGIKARSGTDPSVVAVGISNTSNMTCIDPLDGSYFDDDQPVGGGFVVEFNSDGEAIWSTYFSVGSVLNVDIGPTGSLAIVGGTGGTLPDEQITAPVDAEQWTYSGGGDGFIAQFNAQRQLNWTCYVGGSGGDVLKAVKYGATKIVVAGESTSPTFQQADGGPDAHDASFAGSNDMIILEFKLNGDQQWGTYVGGSLGENLGYDGLALSPATLNGEQDVFLVGVSSSSDLPFEDGPNWYDHTYKPGLQGVLVRFSGEDRSIKWLTYVKGTGTNSDYTGWESICVDREARIFLGGWTTDPNYVTEPADGLYSAENRLGVFDGTIMCFSDAQVMLWSTYFGGAGGSTTTGDHIETVTVLDGERLYVGGYTYTAYSVSNFFPFTDPEGDTDYFDGAFYGPNDGFVASFCIEDLLTAAEEVAARDLHFSAARINSEHYALSGLPVGKHTLRISDIRGRVVSEHLIIGGPSSSVVDLSGFASGVYVFNAIGTGSLKVSHQP